MNRAIGNCRQLWMLMLALLVAALLMGVFVLMGRALVESGDPIGPSAVLKFKPPDGTVFALTFTTDGESLIVGDFSGQIEIIDWRSTNIVKRFKAHNGAIDCLELSSSGEYLATGGADHQAKIWQLAPFGLIEDYSYSSPVTNIALLVEEGYLLVRTIDGGVSVSNVLSRNDEAGVEMDSCEALLDSARFTGKLTVFSPDRRQVAEGFEDGRIRIHDAQDPTTSSEIAKQKSQVNCLTFHPGGAYLAAGGGWTMHPAFVGSSSAYLSIWDTQDGRMVANLDRHTEAVIALAFSQDGEFLASSDLGGRVLVWDVSEILRAE